LCRKNNSRLPFAGTGYKFVAYSHGFFKNKCLCTSWNFSKRLVLDGEEKNSEGIPGHHGTIFAESKWRAPRHYPRYTPDPENQNDKITGELHCACFERKCAQDELMMTERTP
jgi:hypothetical protein